MTCEAQLPLSRRYRRPRCKRSWLRGLGLALTAPLAVLVAGTTVDRILGGVRSSEAAAPLAAAAIVAVACLWLWTFSLVGPVEKLRQRWTSRRIARRPRDPWNIDHRWNPAGTKLWLTEPMRTKLQAPLVLALIVAATCLGFAPPLFAAVTWLALSLWIWGVWRAAGRGRPHVAFTRFPYFPGETVELHFGMSEGGATFLAARYVLTRVREIDQPAFAGGPYRRTAFLAEFVPEAGVLPGPDADVRLVFDVPAGSGGTSLSATLPAYWELRVVGATTSGDFDESFLVPVYERPAAGSATA